jgi:hypothetical protein
MIPLKVPSPIIQWANAIEVSYVNMLNIIFNYYIFILLINILKNIFL